MKTISKIESFEWTESPTILVAGKNIPITYIINPTLSIFKSKIAKKIDEAIENSCDFKPYVLKSMDKGKTWSNITSNLPVRGNSYCLKQDHVDPNLLFVGTEFGAFFTNDAVKANEALNA